MYSNRKNGFVAVSVEAGLSHACNIENMKKPDTLFKKTDEDYCKLGCVSRSTCSSHHSSSESFCPPAPLPPPHLPLHLSCASLIFSLSLFSSSPLLAYLLIRSSIEVLVPAYSSLLNTTAMSISLKTTYSPIAAEAQLVQQEKGISGNVPFRSCSVTANLLNRLAWCTVAAASIKTRFRLDHFQHKTKKSSHHLTVRF